MESLVCMEIYASEAHFVSLIKKNIIDQMVAYESLFENNFGVCEESPVERHIVVSS